MRIGIDIRPLGTASSRRGIGTYIRGLLSGLGQLGLDPPDAFFAFSHVEDPQERLPAGMTCVRLKRPRRAITFWDQWAWPPLLGRLDLDLFHSTFYAVPVLRPRRCRVIQTIYDLTPLRLPHLLSTKNAFLFRINFRLARRADRIIVPSEFTRADVIERLGIQPERITVIPGAAGVEPSEVAAAERNRPDVLRRLGIPGRYLLHTGGHDRTKNLATLIEAFSRVAPGDAPIVLVIVGEHGAETPALVEQIRRRNLLTRVLLPGYVPHDDLIALYTGADAVVYPSLSEGFGLPVLEAMTCGAPVLASRAGAIPEAGGDACLLADPLDVDGIAREMTRLLSDAGLARDLSERGRARAALFTWRETARRTMQVYRELGR